MTAADLNCPLCHAHLHLNEPPTQGRRRIVCARCRGALEATVVDGEIHLRVEPRSRQQDISIPVSNQERVFFRSYHKLFAKNLANYFKQISGSEFDRTFDQTLPQQIYDQLLRNWPAPIDTKALGLVLFQMVRKSLHSEAVLNKLFLHAVRDCAHYLLHNGGSVAPLETLANRFAEAQAVLYDVYYLASRQSDVRAPRMDSEATIDPDMLVKFRHYFERGATGPQVFAYYRGMPVDFPGKVTRVNERGIELTLHRFHLAALTKWPWALMDSPIHGRVLAGRAEEIDIQQGTAWFSEIFNYGPQIERRNIVRVEPEAPLSANLLLNNEVFQGRLYDISIMAAAIYLRNVPVEQGWIGRRTRMVCELPIDERESVHFECEAEILRVRPRLGDDPHAAKVVVMFQLNDAGETLVAQYTARRQSATLQELRTVLDNYPSDDRTAGISNTQNGGEI